MKPKLMKIVTINTVILLLFSVNLFAQPVVKSTGIGLRGSYWKTSNEPTQITVSDHLGQSEVDVGSGGGSIFLFSRINENMWFELSLGGVGEVEEESAYYYTDNNVDVSAITPFLLGLRYELLPAQNQSTLRPYFEFGGGPYWISTVNVRQNYYREEVKVQTILNRGGYLGGGLNFMLGSWFAINFDMKYHFIDFNKKNEYSGFEYGIGFCILWGRYKL